VSSFRRFTALAIFFQFWASVFLVVPQTQAQEAPLVDLRGREIFLPAPPQRIVSLAPSATEVLCAVGACDRIVATDDFSNYPEEVLARPKLGGFRLSAEPVVAQQPDLVVASRLVSPELLDQLEAFGIPTVVADANTFDEVYSSIELLGRVVGSATYGQVIADMRARVDHLTALLATVERRPTVYHELSEGLFTAGPGTFIDDLIWRAGGWNIMASSPVPWPQASAEFILIVDPQVIVLANAAFGMTPEKVAARPGWDVISAVRTGAIYPFDPDIVSRPGPRLADALEMYARILHPELVP
jgi:iron complex transport system substrate-binding protein